MIAAPIVPTPVRVLPERWRQRIAEGVAGRLVDPRAVEALEAATEELEAAIAEAQSATRMVSTREFAELRGVRQSTVRKWCARGLLAGATKNGADDWRVPVTAVRLRKKAKPSSAAVQS